MKKGRFVAVKSDGIIEIHAHGAAGDYYTLCGLDGDDPHKTVSQMAEDVPKGAKINCPQCAEIIRRARLYTEHDINTKCKISQP